MQALGLAKSNDASVKALNYILEAWEEGTESGIAPELMAYAAIYTALTDLVAAFGEESVITLVYWKTGFAWTKRGYEYTLMWGLICFAIALRGGGPYSLDRKLGREL